LLFSSAANGRTSAQPAMAAIYKRTSKNMGADNILERRMKVL
jgi:hypothetical protein